MRSRVIATVPIAEIDRYPLPPPRLDDGAASDEQLARRARSIARLRAEGVPVLESLPVVEKEAQCRFRTRDEILGRAFALVVVGARGSGAPEELVTSLSEHLRAARYYSPNERAFMRDHAPSAEALAEFSWRMESLVVLVWALGYRGALPTPTEPTEGTPIVELFRTRTPRELEGSARMRLPSEILDHADLLYRYDWATTDAWVNRRPSPAGLSHDVIVEWHRALNWLIGYRGAAWDDVPTDT